MPNPFFASSFALPFNEKSATFQVPIVDPEVCLIEPGSGSVEAGDTVLVTWGTTWGAPDSCDCRARIAYRSRLKGLATWGPWNEFADTLNTGKVEWSVPVVASCTEAQIRVQFYDPNRNFLHELIGGKFFIDLFSPTISSFPDPAPGIRVCVGDVVPVSWTATDLCTLVSSDVWLSRKPGDGFPILMSSLANPFGDFVAWPVPFKTAGTEQARVMLEISDGVHVTRDTSATFAIVNPSGIFAQGDSLDISGGGLFTFNMGGFNAQTPVDPCAFGTFRMNFRYAIGGTVPLGEFLPSGSIQPTEPGTDTILTDVQVDNPPVLFDLHYQSFAPEPGAAASVAGQVDTLVTTMESLDGAFPGAISEHRMLIAEVFPTGVSDDNVPRTWDFVLHSVYPNPFNPDVQILLTIPTDAPTRIDIYDVSGRLIRHVTNEPLSRGQRVVRWKGLNQGGRPVGSGVYFVVVEHGGQVRTAKLVLLK
ncbi:MAG: T9SS type A sorting domain-containing protein [Candidatus Krumholzibacteria bacterium]|nr:T9SS type A sorting domain-containing protein [Candidatus Krumholzibacteria bacterium]